MAVVEADTKVILMKDFIGELGIRQDEFQLEDQAHPSKIPLAPGESRRKGFFPNEDPHGGKRIRHANKGPIGRKVGRVSKSSQNDETSHTRVTGEFFGKQVPPDGKSTSRIGWNQ